MADYEKPVFVGQSLTVQLNTKQTVTGATLAIGYEDPIGNVGSWSATIDPLVATKIFYTYIPDTDGIWKVWSDVIFSGGIQQYGKVRTIKILKKGQIN
jgi:hypothetical protein